MTRAQEKIFRILFVCEGNTCRSPMAEASLKAKMPKTLQDSIEILSAGIQTFSGMAPAVEAELAAGRKGYSLSSHKTRQIDEALMETCHLILCMDPSQTRYLRERMPQIAGRIFTFRVFCAGKDEAVEDPYHQDVSVYFKTMDRIDADLNRCKTTIWAMARKHLQES